MDYEQLRAEWDNGIARVMAQRSLGTVCYNCGCDDATELHHIVPLKLGGTNNISNIAVLCHRCHCAAHHGRHIRNYCNKKVSGRPHNVPMDEMISAIEDLIHGRIGRAECKRRMGMSENTKVADMTFYKRYLKEHGIKCIKNDIDMIIAYHGKVDQGKSVGYIEYTDGKTEYLYYCEK